MRKTLGLAATGLLLLTGCTASIERPTAGETSRIANEACLEISSKDQEWLYRQGAIARGVSVVADVDDAGTWIVIAARTDDETVRTILTRVDGTNSDYHDVRQFQDWNIPGWDGERLERGKTALNKAVECALAK